MTQDILKKIHEAMLNRSTTERAISNQWFFKTGRGEYGEGDRFLGLSVPETRKLAKAFTDDMDLKNTEKLLSSPYHEERLLALMILIEKNKKLKNIKDREEIFNLYFKNIKYINNWDLVDLSCSDIVGDYIKDKYKLESKNCSGLRFLLSLVRDKNIFAKDKKEKLWEKRIAIVSTISFMMKPIKNEFSSKIIFSLVEKILNEKDDLNKHDLIQKASGWMLREYGKRVNEEKMKEFLENNFSKIKDRRILLRYSIERLPEKERKEFLNKK